MGCCNLNPDLPRACLQVIGESFPEDPSLQRRGGDIHIVLVFRGAPKGPKASATPRFNAVQSFLRVPARSDRGPLGKVRMQNQASGGEQTR